MIQSIQAGSTAIYNQSGNLLGAGKISVSQTQKAAQAAVQEEDENTTTSIQGDTLTISQAGAQRAA
jgi:hypothetical protein